MNARKDTVRRRHVFYVHAFDPRGPRYDHDLYQREAAKYTGLFGTAIEVGPFSEQKNHRASWTVAADFDNTRVETSWVCLRWEDIVKSTRHKTIWRALGDMWASQRAILLDNQHYKFLLTGLPGYLFAAFPPSVVFLNVLIAMALAYGTYFGLTYYGAPGWAAITGGLVLAGLFFMDTRRFDRKFRAFYLGQVEGFVVKFVSGKRPDMDARILSHAHHLADLVKQRAGQLDEVLLVGHSQGTNVAVSILADALRLDPKLCSRGPRISFLTLGQVFPLFSYPSYGGWFRDNVIHVMGHDIDWIDFSSSKDKLGFSLQNPADRIIFKPDAEIKSRPKVLSAQFEEISSPQTLKSLRFDPFNTHFHYMDANDNQGEYDWFAITAGPQRLGARYGHNDSVI